MKRRPPLTYAQLDALVRKHENGKGQYDAQVAELFRAQRDALVVEHTRGLRSVKVPPNFGRRNGH